MYNSEHKMSPRISFSNDFVESNSQLHSKKEIRGSSNSRSPISSSSTDFEFSVSNTSSLQLTAADELFFKGRILPMKDHPFHRPTTTTSSSTTTLRDELLAGNADDDDSNVFSLKPPLKGRWKGLVGLRKSHIGSRKTNSNDHKQQGMMREGGGTSAADMEMKQ